MTHGRMDQLDSMGRLGRLGQLGRMSRMGRMLHDVNYSINLTAPRCQIHRETGKCEFPGKIRLPGKCALIDNVIM